MSARQIHGCLVAFAAGTSVALAGCASSSIQTDATNFLNEHTVTARRVAVATKAVAAAASRLSSSPSRSQLEQLAHAAAQARRSSVLAGEWNVAKSGEGGEEGIEEEDLPRAETEATKDLSRDAKMGDPVGKMKQFTTWFTHGVPGGAKLRAAIYHARNGEDVLSEVEHFFVARIEAGESAEPETGAEDEDEAQAFPDAALVCD